MNALGIDIGGSALKGAPVNPRTGRLLAERVRIPTPEPLSPAQMARAVAELARHFRWRGPIGVGFPGVIHGTRILTAANMHPKFVAADAGKLFARSTGCRVAMINDAAAAAIAEMRFGAGRGFMGKVLLLTLGTGVGSALAYQGVVVPLELGHLPWGKKGDSAERHVAASVREDKDLDWDEWGERLRDYVAVLERILWPELIIVGGGVSAKHKKFFRFIKARAKLVPAEFLNQAGIAGAAIWAAEAK
jgi:polyphosphate glucokinase